MQDNFDLKNLITSKKKRKNSRTKGNSFERKVCSILNEFFETTEFIRSPGSGAFSTTHNLPDHLKFSGDLITPKSFKFTIECKKGYNKENIGSVFNTKSDLMYFIEQAEKDSQKIQKNFMIIFQQDRKDILCLFKEKGSLALATYAENNDHIYLSFLKERYIICRLVDILNTTKIYNAKHLWI
jgi:Holliday junction resolvase